MIDSFKEKRDSAVRIKLKEFFAKFGHEYGKNDHELFEVPDIKGKLNDIKQKTF